MATTSPGLNKDTCSTLVELLRGYAGEQPHRTVYYWLSDGETAETTMTYGELDRRARAIGARLQQMQTAGSRALLCHAPGLEFITAFLGCLYSGVTAVPAYAPHSRRDISRLKSISSDCDPSLILTTGTHARAAENLLSGAGHEHNCLITDNVDWDTAGEWKQPDLKSSDLAYLQYTSGSTTTPKGVMISHANLLANLDYIDRSGDFDSESVSISWLPHFHDMGLIYGILQPIYSRFPAYLFSPAAFIQQPLRWLQAISDHRVTHTGGPNFAYDLCHERVTEEQLERLDLHCWRIAFNGSEPVHQETLERFAKRFSGCGMPESGRHYHAVLGCVLSVTPQEVQEIWMEMAGRQKHGAGAKVEIYDPNRNGLSYVLKSINHPDSDWHLSLVHPPILTK